MTQIKIPRSAPYLAPGAPKSPRIVAIAGVLVTLAALVASWWGLELPTDPNTVGIVAGVLATLVGLWQDRGARREQAAGVLAPESEAPAE
jgi:uncharacterized membrane protein